MIGALDIRNAGKVSRKRAVRKETFLFVYSVKATRKRNGWEKEKKKD